MKNLNNFTIKLKNFNLAQTLDCGQCFRWEQLDDGSFHGVVFGKYKHVRQDGDDITFFDTTQEEFEEIWKEYFDFDQDYEKINKLLKKDPTLKKAISYAGGIRILKQESWEALCSFIISQNNNIPRIKGIITRLCEKFGDQIGKGVYTFPSAEKLSELSIDDLAEIRSGFRAKYILDAAKKYSSLNADIIKNGTLDCAAGELMSIKGVGIKVASCALLFGFYRLDAFPIDVWVRRVLDVYYPDGFPQFAKPYGGIAQQYLFHYIRKRDV